jgi:Zn-dependent protease
MFIDYLRTDRVFYVQAVFTVALSVVLHELGHGLAAIWEGDDTPRSSGHITLNPVTHMGWLSLGLLFFSGIAWGQMPVNPSRFRHRYGDVLVSLAGPLTNLLLATVFLTAVGLWDRHELRAMNSRISTAAHQSGEQPQQSFSEAMEQAIGPEPSPFEKNLRQLLWIIGYTNIALCLFNLLPVPPLDGSRILAGLNHGYAGLISSANAQSVMYVAFGLAFLCGRYIFEFAGWLGNHYLDWLLGRFN